MLTLDAVRAAVLSDQPWTRLDELVRAELSSGRTTRQIYKSLMSIADEIDATPGLPENGSDAFGDALDALTGMCHPDCQYKDPPNAALPSEEELAELPRWARVAFAARCARRVLPLYARMWKEAPPEKLTNLQQACEAAEAVAQRAGTFELTESHWMSALDAEDAAVAHGTASYAAAAVTHAASSALRALRGQAEGTTLSAVEAACEAAAPIANIAPTIRRDFDQLANVAEGQRWTDDTPAPPEVFGPLWPEGPPKNWPAAFVPAEV